MPANVFSIAPGLPFLRTLANGLLDGRILPGLNLRDDPLALAGLTIYLPTRRAVRALGQEFARALGGAAAILPAIRTLGEGDAAALFAAPTDGAGLLPTIGAVERRMLIARFVRRWKGQIAEMASGLLDGEEIVLPTSSADALWLARDLARLFDEVEAEGTTLTALSGLAPERLAGWWQLTLTFLQILTDHWPAVLAERGLADEAQAQNEHLRREAARIAAREGAGPVVVAGSTAASPATLALMRAVARRRDGALVLPGLDRFLDEASFDAIRAGGETRLAGSAPGHPQYVLKRMLTGLLVPRDAVDHLAPSPGDPLAAREAFVSDALRPAATTDAWGEPSHRHPPEALADLALVEAENEREEALAIAVAMRDALADPSATVGLTTPDRSLARRVSAELERFGIAANDSAGRPLAATAPGTLMSLTLACALTPGDPVTLVALLKHPLVRLGHSAVEARRAARAIEILALRGNVGIADAAGLSTILDKAMKAFDRQAAEAEAAPAQGPAPRIARAVRLVSPADRLLACDVARKLEAALRPLTDLRGAPEAQVALFALALTRALEALAADENGTPTPFYATETGAAAAAFLQKLVACPETGFAFPPRELPDVVEALIADESVRPRGGLSGRAFIWGALEARLQQVDCMILGGLNEGSWPQRSSSDAFLSRLMRAEVLLEPPERLIGLAAHDIQMALGMRRVVMTRSLRSGGAPTIASRWLQRLLTLAGPEGAARLRAEGEVYLYHACRIDIAKDGLARTERPAPVPPPERRPNRYSVTEVERLIRDPYAVYARRVLKLEAFPELMRSPGAADRGNLFHAILADFVAEGGDPADAGAETRLLAAAARRFEAERLPPDIEAVWWPRMERLAGNYIAWERERAPNVVRRLVETRGQVELPEIGVTLSGYADRIDVLADGTVEIIDFKTGTNPSVRQARVLLAPQLPLEGAMAKLGAFPETKGPVGAIAELSYLRLRERELFEEGLSYQDRRSGEAVTGDSLSDEALDRFRGLAAFYREPETPFLSRARPFRAGDVSGEYDHLARVLEWAAGEDAEEAE
ncbi:double-strand break repair protein AddB [Aureimonas endophytica]|uniref:Double-strand break repair protein AddB n=1 Tax=Aureimonas endophytica TaxID=2027858 RepID=A0A917A2Z2_9HYPH|nr:double-strand break repair protein AddB [Aureimonas endophytica]GGE21629.1 double-strand break repair protein AddB [Aureimonas endophytica]